MSNSIDVSEPGDVDPEALRDSLSPDLVCRVTDPNDISLEIDNTVSPATPTTDPHRMTFVVPTPDNTIVSFGQAGPANRISETGITGKTKSHVHWQTTTAPNTIVTLGLPAPTVMGVSDAIAEGNAPEEKPGAPEPEPKEPEGGADDGPSCGPGKGELIATILGYGMFTDGEAWTDSRKKFTVVSRREDVAIRTQGREKCVSLQADLGKVIAYGMENATVASQKGVIIGADSSLTFQDINKEATWAPSWTANMGAKIGSQVSTVGEVATSVMGLVAAFPKAYKKPKPKETGWQKAARLVPTAKFIADGALFLSTVVRGLLETVAPAYEAPGTTSVYGERFASVTAGIGATMYGQFASAVVSVGQAEVLGGLSAIVKGLAWTEIAGGLGTALTAMKDVEIQATHGEVTMEAKKNIEISSEEGEIMLGGHKLAQLTANEAKGEAFVHAPHLTYVGVGADAGWGLRLDGGGKELQLGQIESGAGSFASAKCKADNCVVIKPNEMTLTINKAQLTLKPSGLTLYSGSTQGLEVVKGGNVFIRSHGKVLID